MDYLLTAASAARIFNVVPATVCVMALSGRLPVAATTEGSIRLFRREDVEALANARARTTTPSTGATSQDAETEVAR